MLHYRVRMEIPRGGVARVILWFAWLAFIVVMAAEPFVWQVKYFRIHGNVLYFQIVVILLLLLVPVCLLYVRWRHHWYRYELPVIVGTALCLAAIEQPLAVAVGVLFFVSCLTAGLCLARLSGLAFESAGETVGLGFLLGAAAMIPALFVLGLLHAYYWPIFLLMMAAPIALAWRDARVGVLGIARLFRAATNISAFEHPLCGIAVLFVAAAILCGTVATLAPTIVMDAVRMHLPAAQYYTLLHVLEPVPGLTYSYFPQGYETMVAAAYSLGSQPAARMITPAFMIAFLLVIVEIARACAFDWPAALAGVAAVLLTPFILWSGSQMKNDLEMSAFQLAALYFCLRWRATGDRGWLMLGALLVASSFGIKHTAAFGAIPITLLFMAPLYGKPRSIRMAALFFLLVGAFGFYWHLRTYLLVGDPLYPRHMTEVVRAKKKGFSRRRGWVAVHLKGPLEVQLNDTRKGFESPLRSPMGIVVLVFAPLAILAARMRNGSRRACWFFVVLNLLLWTSRMITLRYALGAIAVMILLVAAKVMEAYEQQWTLAPRLMRFSIGAAFAGALAFGLLGAVLVEIVPGQLELLAHRIGPVDYLKMNLPAYAAVDAVGHVSPGAAVLIIDGCGRAYAPDPIRSVCVFSSRDEFGFDHIRHNMDARSFQYAILPVEWDKRSHDAIFGSWKTENVYQDRGWRAFRIAPGT
jgi:hypothetical protein